MADQTPDELKKSYQTFITLRYVLLGVLVVVGIIYAILISYTTKNNVAPSPFILLIPAISFSAFGAYVTDKKCPQCGGKFYGKPWRLFESTCESCGWGGE